MTKIEWADKTINPIVGCSKVSRACDLCYAADVAFNIEHVLTKDGNAKPRANYEGVSRKDKDGRPNWTSRVNYDPTVLQRLSPGQAPKRFFVNSMSDFFHPKVKLEWLQEIFAHFARCPQHTFLVLTKRPENALKLADKLDWHANVWLGCTVEDDTDEVIGRVDKLRMVPAARRFISAEPLTADVAAKLDLTGIDWVIAGGETSPRTPRRISRTWSALWTPPMFWRCATSASARALPSSSSSGATSARTVFAGAGPSMARASRARSTTSGLRTLSGLRSSSLRSAGREMPRRSRSLPRGNPGSRSGPSSARISGTIWKPGWPTTPGANSTSRMAGASPF